MASAHAMDFGALIPIPSGINSGLTAASQSVMLALFGAPGKLTTECSPVTNAALAKLMVTKNVGPFTVHGLEPAVEALVRIFADVKAHEPNLYAALTTAGMTCCRAVRGSTKNFSNHSWGTAIDLSIHGHLTPLGSKTVQRGMVEAAPFFAKEKFFWGAGFHTRPDGMHFEASNELLHDWKAHRLVP